MSFRRELLGKDFTGADSFTYRITDGLEDSTATVTVKVKVNPVNDLPVAVADSATVDEDGSVPIEVLGNDSDAEADPLRLVSISAPAHGTAVIEDGAVRYTPAADFFGSDAFTYVVSDNKVTSTGTVTVQVRSEVDPPVARDDSAATDEDRSVLIPVLVNDSDPDAAGCSSSLCRQQPTVRWRSRAAPCATPRRPTTSAPMDSATRCGTGRAAPPAPLCRSMLRR